MNRIEKLIPKRNIVFGSLKKPQIVGYACPICGNKGHCLARSEYSGFIVCKNTETEMPSILCLRDIKRATDIYLDLIEEIRDLYRPYDTREERLDNKQAKTIKKATLQPKQNKMNKGVKIKAKVRGYENKTKVLPKTGGKTQKVRDNMTTIISQKVKKI